MSLNAEFLRIKKNELVDISFSHENGVGRQTFQQHGKKNKIKRRIFYLLECFSMTLPSKLQKQIW
jgi:hypothetical protein